VEPTLVSVCHSLGKNNISDEGCKALAAALQNNTTLTYLEWVMMCGRMGGARRLSQHILCVCLSQLADQQGRRRGMQGACGGAADEHHADEAGVSDDDVSGHG
jgi:hypothetical protein